MLNIALLQIEPAGSLRGNLEKGRDMCRRAVERGADIALFPEMWSCGYTIPQEQDTLRALAVERDGEFVNAFGRLARELHMASPTWRHSTLCREIPLRCLTGLDDGCWITQRFTPVILEMSGC